MILIGCNQRTVITSPNNPKNIPSLQIVLQQISRGSCYLRWAITKGECLLLYPRNQLCDIPFPVQPVQTTVSSIFWIFMFKSFGVILVCCPEDRIFIAVNWTQLKDKCHIKRSTYMQTPKYKRQFSTNVRRVESLNLIFKIF